MIGTILDGKYRIDRLLGKGGMGAVYAGEEVGTGQAVAVKIIQASVPVHQKDLVARFEREARAAGSIDTEHIARCLGAGTDPTSGQPYMVLEYLEGEDLQRVLRRTGPLDPDVALRITAQACEGLRAAHAAGIIHRDIKPANLFLAKRAPDSDERVVKILDFGIAKIIRDPGEEEAANTGNLTRTGSLLGSPLYMSPEQARSVKKVDQRADLWSLGVVLYKQLAGRTPFDHVSAIGDMILALWTEPPAPVQQFAPWIPIEVASLLDHLLQTDPANRFQSAEEVDAAIRALLPGGTTVREPMLVGLSAEAKERTAPLFFRRFDGRARPQTNPNPAPPPRAITSDPPLAQSDASAGVTPPNPGTLPAQSLAPAVHSSSSQPGLTHSGLATTGASGASTQRSAVIKTLAIAAAVALGAGIAFLVMSRGQKGAEPPHADVATSGPATSETARSPNTPTVVAATAEEPAKTAATALVPATPPSVTATPVPSAHPSAHASTSQTTTPTAKPKASSAPTATASAAPAATPKFTDFGDRK
ncbi:MAG: protein kinase [Polyangiaceae bacterium]